MKWIKREIDREQIKQLAKRYNLDMLTASIFMRRGLTRPEDLLFYLEDDILFLHNPFHFKDMGKVVERIKQAAAHGEKISIYGDRDVDGITSTVLIVDCLRSLGADVEWRVPLGDDDYGLSFSDIDNAHKAGATLLITVDCGISNHKEVDYALEKNIQTIIIDHHNPRGTLPRAYAIINPKLADSGYPFRDLSGCGVVFKADWALHFSQAEIYDKEYCLFLVRPAHDSYCIEGVRLKNLIEIDRFRENIVPGMLTLEQSGFLAFLSQAEVFGYNKEEQEKLLLKAFPAAASLINFTDLKPLTEKAFPESENKSLLHIRETSKQALYVNHPLTEMEVLKALFTSVMFKNAESLLNGCMERLDLVTLGTIADMMPLVNENRIIVKKGLKLINSFNREGLRELFFKTNLQGKTISTWDIVWQISPIINASGRLGEPDKAVELLLSSTAKEKEILIDHLFELNKKRKAMGDSVWDDILKEAHECYEKTEGKGIIIASPVIHRGITGIIATRLVNYFQVPVVIIALLKHRAVGSVRSIPNFKLQELLIRFQDLFSDYGGHDFAAGFSLPLENLSCFMERYFLVSKEIALPLVLEKNLVVDAEIPCAYLKPDLFSVVELFKPFGEGNPALLFLTRGLDVESCEVVGRKEQVHLKLLLNTGSFKFPAMIWNGVDLYKQRFNMGEKVDIIYKMQANYFMHKETLQLIIEDIYQHNKKQVLNNWEDEEK